MTDQTPQGGLYGPQSAPDDSRAAEGATEAGDGRVAGTSDYYAPDPPIGCALPTPAPDAGLREQYAARAFNAVAPALKAHDRWLPLSVRRAVADAVLAVRDAELERLRAQRDFSDETARRFLEQRQELAAERYEWQQCALRAEAALGRVRGAAALHRKGLISTAELYAVIGPALDGQQPGEAS